MNLGRLPAGTRYVLGVSSGEGLHRRSTLRNGDIVITGSGWTMVGRGVAVEDIYPDLWSDWRWES